LCFVVDLQAYSCDSFVFSYRVLATKFWDSSAKKTRVSFVWQSMLFSLVTLGPFSLLVWALLLSLSLHSISDHSRFCCDALVCRGDRCSVNLHSLHSRRRWLCDCSISRCWSHSHQWIDSRTMFSSLTFSLVHELSWHFVVSISLDQNLSAIPHIAGSSENYLTALYIQNKYFSIDFHFLTLSSLHCLFICVIVERFYTYEAYFSLSLHRFIEFGIPSVRLESYPVMLTYPIEREVRLVSPSPGYTCVLQETVHFQFFWFLCKIHTIETLSFTFVNLFSVVLSEYRRSFGRSACSASLERMVSLW
jgi:hypothetical protein